MSPTPISNPTPTFANVSMTAPNYTLPPPIYLPSSGGHTSSRFIEDPLHQRVFPYRKYSVDNDGRLVCRTRNANREPRPKPYDRPQGFSERVTSPGVDRHESTPPPTKKIDPSTFAQLFQQLISIATKEPSAFECKALAICASFDLDPITSADVVSSIKSQLPAARNQETVTPVPGGPTDPEPIANPAASAAPATPPTGPTAPPLMPLKQQRPFTSGPRGLTVWYSTESSQPIPTPLQGLHAFAGTLYVHTDTNLKFNQTWLCDMNGKWLDVTGVDNVKHPTIPDRFLLVRSDGIPSWVTKVDYAAIQTRRAQVAR